MASEASNVEDDLIRIKQEPLDVVKVEPVDKVKVEPQDDSAPNDESLSHQDAMQQVQDILADLIPSDPLLQDLLAQVTLEEVNSMIALEHGQAMVVYVRKEDDVVMPIVVIQDASVLDFKQAIRRYVMLKQSRAGATQHISCKMTSTESEVEAGVSDSTLKRKRREENWKKTKAKYARNKGEAYTSYSTKQPVSARVVGPACKCGCFDKIGMDIITEIFTKFWQMADFNHQNAYISKLVTTAGVKNSRVKDKSLSRQQRRIVYSVMHDNTVHSVCRNAFYSIHGIKEKRVRNVLAKTSLTGVTEPDMRGHAYTKTPDERRQSVIEHIASVPMVSSHYSRARNPHRTYLPPGLNIIIMYTLYLEWLTDNNIVMEPVSNRFYRDVFNTEFNVGLEPPHSDTCNYCDLVNNELRELSAEMDSEKIVKLQEEKNKHLVGAKEIQNILKDCKNIPDPCVAALCFDFQRALPTPKLTTGVQYYKRKLWTYNFGIHDLKTGKAVMYIWNESAGKRGSAEMASCLQHYITTFVDSKVKTLRLFNGNCGGQNKNINMVLFCLQKIHEGRFTKIEHFFMVPGHSYFPCDRDFENIEKKIRSVEVFSQPNYAELIKACRHNKPFHVINMQRDWFLDVAVLQANITKSVTAGANFKNGKVFVYVDAYKQGFGIKTTYRQTNPVNVQLQKGRSGSYEKGVFDLATVHLPRKYPTPVKLHVETLRDIEALLDFIPPHHKPFMVNLIAEQQTLIDAVDVDDHDSDDDFLEY